MSRIEHSGRMCSIADALGSAFTSVQADLELRTQERRKARYIADQARAARAAEQADLEAIADMLKIDLANGNDFQTAQALLGEYRTELQAVAHELGVSLAKPENLRVVRDLVAKKMNPEIVAAKYGADMSDPDQRKLVEELARV